MDNTLKNSLERLKSVKIILPEVCLHPGEPIHLNKWLKRTAMNSAGRVEIDKDIRERLYSKVKQLARGKSITFDQRKEVPLLPLLLANKLNESPDFYKVLEQELRKVCNGNSPRSVRRNTFRNMVFCYFQVYRKPSQGESLQKWISLFLKKSPELLKSVLYLRNRKKLLEPNGHRLLSKEIEKQQSIRRALEEFCWPFNLRSGNFVSWAVKDFFALGKNNNWDALFRVLNELCIGNTSWGMVPAAAEKMIYLTDQARDGEREKKLRILLFKTMGDPRDHQDAKTLSWTAVDQKAQNIFISWLKKNDLNLFFSVISKTVRESSTSEDMWEYRKNFWEQYLDAMYYTRVFLGPRAEEIAKNMNLNRQSIGFGRVKASGNQLISLLMFSIGDYVFIEVSHNGRLRIWKRGKEPLPFYESKFSYPTYSYSNDVVGAGNVVEQFNHSGKEVGSWQGKVRTWIRLHCHVNIRQNKWR